MVEVCNCSPSAVRIRRSFTARFLSVTERVFRSARFDVSVGTIVPKGWEVIVPEVGSEVSLLQKIFVTASAITRTTDVADRDW